MSFEYTISQLPHDILYNFIKQLQLTSLYRLKITSHAISQRIDEIPDEMIRSLLIDHCKFLNIPFDETVTTTTEIKRTLYYVHNILMNTIFDVDKTYQITYYDLFSNREHAGRYNVIKFTHLRITYRGKILFFLFDALVKKLLYDDDIALCAYTITNNCLYVDKTQNMIVAAQEIIHLVHYYNTNH